MFCTNHLVHKGLGLLHLRVLGEQLLDDLELPHEHRVLAVLRLHVGLLEHVVDDLVSPLPAPDARLNHLQCQMKDKPLFFTKRITLSSLLVICTALTMQPTVMLRVVLLFPSWEEKMHWVLAGFPSLRAFTMMSKHSKGSAFSSRNGTLTTFIPLSLSAARSESMVLKPLTTPSTVTTSVISSLSRGFSLSSLSRKISIVPPSSIDLSSTCLTNSS